MKCNLFIYLFLLASFISRAENKEIPYTMEDRDRLIRLEIKVEEGFKAMEAKFDARFKAQDEKFDARFDALQKQMDFLNSLMITLIASVIGSVFYMAWDRNRANAPLKEAIDEDRKKSQTLLKALKEYSDSHPELKAIFDRAAIL